MCIRDSFKMVVPCAVTDGGPTEVGTTDGGGTDTPGTCFDATGISTTCPTDGGALTCDYLGKSYPVGASFTSSDGCNTCSCQSGGYVACTLRACFDASVDG